MRLYTQHTIITIVVLLTILTGCGGGSGGSVLSDTGTDITTTEPASSSQTVQKGQVTDYRTHNPIANVKVSIGKTSTTTDENGFYSLSELKENDEVTINFEKEEYLSGSTQIQLKTLAGDNTAASNYLEYHMYSHDYRWDYSSSEAITSTRIDIDASVSYVNIDGTPYEGVITAELTILDSNEVSLIPTFPGTFKGVNHNGTVVQFETYGFIHISLKDSSHNVLHFANNETGTLTFKPASSLQKPDTLPLWYYNYTQGIWVEDGYAELQPDGSYTGEISHPGSWSINKVLEVEPGIFRAQILNNDGTPAKNMRVFAFGNNWSSADLSTDENGRFAIEVIPDNNFKLKSYDYKDKFEAKYAGTIAAISSGVIIE